MQGSNLLVMPNRDINPESDPALRKEIRQIKNDLGQLKNSFNGGSVARSGLKDY
jgi:hypothetical protein